MCTTSPSTDRADAAHAELRDVRKQQRADDYRAAILLRKIDDERLYQVFGYANVRQYAKVEHEMAPRLVSELLLIARRLDALPAMDKALASGELDKTKARELVRVVNAGNEAVWLDRIQGLSNRAIEQLVTHVGDDGLPPAHIEPEAKPARVRFSAQMDSAELDLVRSALAMIRLQTGVGGDELEDGALLALMARYVLAHPEPEVVPTNAEPYRIVLQHCPTCAATHCDGAHVSDTIVDEAGCDAVITEMREGPTQGHSRDSIPPAARMRALAKANFRCGVPHCRNRFFLEIHHIDKRDGPNPHRDDNLLSLCWTHHRVVHNGLLAIERNPDGTLRFVTARGPIVPESERRDERHP